MFRVVKYINKYNYIINPVAPYVNININKNIIYKLLKYNRFSTNTTTANNNNNNNNKKKRSHKRLDSNELLDQSLKYVNDYGWNIKAISQAAKDNNMSASVHGIYDKADIQLVEHFMKKCNRELIDKVKENKELFRDMRTIDKLKTCLRLRLKLIHPYMQRWNEAMSIGILPQNIPLVISLLSEMIDDIWHIVGDRSTDINWYTKRMSLAGVYVATEIYMTTDDSVDYENTWRFLDNRIEELNTLSKMPNNINSVVSSAFNLVSNFINNTKK